MYTCTYIVDVKVTWDATKAAANKKARNISFADAQGVFEDEFMLSMVDDDADRNEIRLVAIGEDYLGRILTVAYTVREDEVRLISARKATSRERAQYEEGR